MAECSRLLRKFAHSNESWGREARARVQSRPLSARSSRLSFGGGSDGEVHAHKRGVDGDGWHKHEGGRHRLMPLAAGLASLLAIDEAIPLARERQNDLSSGHAGKHQLSPRPLNHTTLLLGRKTNFHESSPPKILPAPSFWRAEASASFEAPAELAATSAMLSKRHFFCNNLSFPRHRNSTAPLAPSHADTTERPLGSLIDGESDF